VYDQTAPVAGRCVVAHPDSKARVKTDIQDAKRWAERLLADDFKPVWAPPQAVRELRSLLAYRQRQVTARTRLKNRLQGLLHAQQLAPPEGALFSQEQRDWWASLPLSEIDHLRCQQDLAALDLVEGQLKQLEQKLAAVSQQEPWRGDCLRLLQLPGVGLIVAMTLLAAIGDIRRFERGPSGRAKLVGYAGLGAAIDQSGEKHRHGGITKSGRKDLRHMLVEAAPIAVRQPGHWQRLYQRLARRIGDHKAITAVARKLLVAVWHLLTHGSDGAPTAALLSPQQLAAKSGALWARLAGRLTKEQRRGLRLHDFAAYALTLIGLAGQVPAIVQGESRLPLLSPDQLRHRFPHLDDDPLFAATSGEP
ncbi:MAG: IS110 family transposase, partial [Caldilineaceae bacterium]|nr:IS110 family transposase [Caldilineaceae bacterium]